AVFGKARPPVVATLGKYAFRTTIAVYGGKSYVGVRKSHRDAAKLEPGQTISVVIELDDAPRTVTPPLELDAAMKKDAKARAAWDAPGDARRPRREGDREVEDEEMTFVEAIVAKEKDVAVIESTARAARSAMKIRSISPKPTAARCDRISRADSIRATPGHGDGGGKSEARARVQRRRIFVFASFLKISFR
ncbi:MAG TPA: DUF1905 domain-containing protein, partial [Polyangiaceae bacterium]